MDNLEKLVVEVSQIVGIESKWLYFEVRLGQPITRAMESGFSQSLGDVLNP